MAHSSKKSKAKKSKTAKKTSAKKKRKDSQGLETYREKRDFGKTPEPAGKVRAKDGGPLLFVVQKHDATRLHYDFRLEWDGVLKSWAVPKGPSMYPKDRRLAVRTEDHPLEYGEFEGVIPEGEYGGGPVVVWDRGAWVPLEDPAKGFRKGRLAFRLEGVKLKGEWRLVRSGKNDGDKEQWLLIKKTDRLAASAGDLPIVEARPESVLTGRTVEEVAEKRDRMWGRQGELDPATGRKGTRKRSLGPNAGELVGARPGNLPKKPQAALATLVKEPPAGDEWLHEIKLDGYRILAALEGGKARLVSRNGNDWTQRFAPVANALRSIAAGSALLDGEVAVLDERGITSFHALQAAASIPTSKFRYFVFDLLYLDGHDLTGVPLVERKEALRALLAASAPLEVVQFSDHVVGHGEEFFRTACGSGVEGIVSKRATSRYSPSRTKDWLKVKCTHRQEFVVVGFTNPQGARTGFGALVLAVHEAGELRYAGKAGTGFTEEDLRSLRKRMAKLERNSAPIVDPPRGAEGRAIHWLEPGLVAEVEFTEWTPDGKIRHPSFQGLRADKKPADVVREVPSPLPAAANATARTPAAKTRRTSAAKAPRKGGDPVVAGVRLTHPERVLWSEEELTKEELAAHWLAVADRALAEIASRPLTLLRCPDGREGQCFFQKQSHVSIPNVVPRFDLVVDGEDVTYMMIDGESALVGLAQASVLEVHVWGSRVDRLEKPDRMIFDIDPGPDVVWPRVALAAVALRDLLADVGLESWLKSTGGKGLHVVVPIERRAGWEEVKAFSRAVAERLAEERPDEYTSKLPKKYREGRLYIDYLRNDRNSTAIAPYSTRARPGAPVAVPLAWEELLDHEETPVWTVRTVAERLTRTNPWADLGAARQSITKAMKRAVES
ncbi:MAG TPA: DNA ligase D [Gemmatimonadota bacterium]|nr:DNA ligase D [Gemmatimonadota bacterium]